MYSPIRASLAVTSVLACINIVGLYMCQKEIKIKNKEKDVFSRSSFKEIFITLANLDK